jgi:hypothetical protein
MKAFLITRPNPDSSSPQRYLVHLQRFNHNNTLGDISPPIVAIETLGRKIISLKPHAENEWLRVEHISGNCIAGNPMNDKSGLAPNTYGETSQIVSLSFREGAPEPFLYVPHYNHEGSNVCPVIDFGANSPAPNDPFRWSGLGLG